MKTLLNICLFFVIAGAAFGQSDTPQLKYWNGGEINFNLAGSINTMGGGQGSGGFGRVIAPGVSFGAASIFTNPAEIAILKNPVVFIDTRFSMSTQTVGLDLNSEINKSVSSGTNDYLKDTTTFIFKPGTPRNDTKVNAFSFGQAGQFGTFALALPVSERIVLGFGVNYPIDVSSSFLLTGLRMKMESKKKVGTQEVSIALPLATSFASNFNFSVNALTIGAAAQLMTTSLGTTFIGASANRYQVAEYLNFNLKIDGMMILNKNQEYHFNDPSDPNIDRAAGQSNDFYWLARGDYKTESWGFRIGLVQKTERFNFVAALDIVPDFTMTDDKFINKSYQPKFFTGRALGDGDEALDILIDSLDLARPNLTVPTNNSFASTVETIYPSTFTVGADGRFGDWTFGLNVVKYLKEFSFTFDKYKFGKALDWGFKFSTDVRLPEKPQFITMLLTLPLRFLYADIDGAIFQLLSKYTKYSNPRYRIEGGLLTGDAIVEGFAPDQKKSLNDGLSMPLPSGFALTREYTVFDKLNVGVLVFGFPDFAFRFGIGYML